LGFMFENKACFFKFNFQFAEKIASSCFSRCEDKDETKVETTHTRESAETFPREGGNGKKPNSTIKPLPGGGGNGKRPKNNTIKPLSTISVPCKKSRAATAPLPPAANVHEHIPV